MQIHRVPYYRGLWNEGLTQMHVGAHHYDPENCLYDRFVVFLFFYFFKQDQLLRSPTSTYPSFGSILRLSTLHR